MSSGAASSDPEPRKDVTPAAVWDTYVSRKGDKRRHETLQLAKNSWDLFCEWCESEGIEYLSGLGPYFPGDFRVYLESHTDMGDISIYYTLTRMKQVAEFAQNRGLIHQQYPHDNWNRPELDKSDRQRDEYLLPERGREISDFVRLEYTYQKEHVIWKLAWDYGLRKSAIRSLDREQVAIDPKGENPPHLRLEDRPDLGGAEDKGLPLKNTLDRLAGRKVPIREEMVEVLRGYIANERTDNGTDEYDLEALITTKRSARISENGIYITTCKITSPATYRGLCKCEAHQEFREQHGRSCGCEWCETYDLRENRELPTQQRYKCDKSRGPHAVRHGAITQMVNSGQDFPTISHIVGTSPDTLRKTYDRRSDDERMNAIAPAWLGDGD